MEDMVALESIEVILQLAELLTIHHHLLIEARQLISLVDYQQ
jgi:hypothetical protein